MSLKVIMDLPAIPQCWYVNQYSSILAETSVHCCQVSPLGKVGLLFQDHASLKEKFMSFSFS